ncbi:MAG: flagellar filament capping protein FliD [Thermoguttaceae bacterium]|jgi:flagellar hook-associated protein 2
MAGVQLDTGLFSGIPITSTINQLVAIDSQPVTALQTADTTLQSQQTALSSLSALLLNIQLTAKNLEKSDLYSQTSATSSDATALAATVTGTPPVGSYQFTPYQTAQTQQLVSSEVSSDTAALGGGTLTFRFGAGVDQTVSLALLNGGQGISRGKIQITDGSGTTATVDLSAAQTVNDVLSAINNSGVDVTATFDNGHFQLTDNTGATTSDLKVQEVGSGSTAASLGLTALTSGSGQPVLQLSAATPLTALNDGAGLEVSTALPDIKYVLSNGDQGTIDLSPILPGTATVRKESNLGQVLAELNAADKNLQFSINTQGTGLVAVDKTATSDNDHFQLAAINSSNALHDLGLDGSESGGTIAGRSIFAGSNTVLLSSLNGGKGLGTLGSLQLTDRNGATATVDLSQVQTLQKVIDAINGATTTQGKKLGITAEVNPADNGIQLVDTTGGTASNLIVASSDATASSLGLAFNGAAGSVNSGDLHLRVFGYQTALSTLNGGAGVADGSLTITDSSGASATLNVTSAMQTVGDVLDAINRLPLGVRAELNATGDGILLEDTAGGKGALTVTEGSSTTAHDLHLLGAATTQTIDNAQHQVIDGSVTQSITLASTDSLQDLATKINALNAGVTASVFSEGTNQPYRLSLTSNRPGQAGALLLDTSKTQLSLQETVHAQNAVLEYGNSGNANNNVLLSSSNNQFQNVISGVNLQMNQATGQPVSVSVASDNTNLVASVQTLVTDYNQFQQQLATDTNYDTTSNTGAVLTNDPAAAQLQTELPNMLGASFGGGSIQSLADLGVTFQSDGTLAFDQSQLTAAYAANPSGVQKFFSDTNNGMAKRLDNLLTQVAGQSDSLISNRVQALNTEVQDNQDRITQMNTQLDNERNLLYTQFYNMDAAIAKLQSEMSLIGSLSYIDSSGNSSTSTASSTANLGSLFGSSGSSTSGTSGSGSTG